jgi:hypothetical protein
MGLYDRSLSNLKSGLDNREVVRVVSETGYAYDITAESGPINADYAEFASANALGDFRRAFGDPGLSHEQLCRLLRGASSKERRRQCKTPWAIFMANYIERNAANGNTGVY